MWKCGEEHWGQREQQGPGREPGCARWVSDIGMKAPQGRPVIFIAVPQVPRRMLGR